MPASTTHSRPTSGADLLGRLGGLTVEQRRGFIATLTDLERAYLDDLLTRGVRRPWSEIARPDQIAPVGEWVIWLILAGRGWGKTLTGAQWSAEFVRDHPGCRFALVAATFADGRDTMMEGETGLLSVLEDHELRGGTRDKAWNRSMGELFLANGSQVKVFSSEKPDSLRGPQHHGGWGDEPAKWKDADDYGREGTITTWDNFMLGLRLGEHPRCVVTGTPEPNALIRGRVEVVDDVERRVPGLPDQPDTVVTTGTTYDNLANLAPAFQQQVLSRYEGTRIGLQELHGQILTDVVGALWRLQWIRRRPADEATPTPTQFERTLVTIDPALTATEASDETGIVAGGIDAEGCPWVFEDRSGKYSADGWATVAVNLAVKWTAAIAVEDNAGGDLVTDALARVIDGLPSDSFRPQILRVTAIASKEARAAPIAQVYERAAVAGGHPVVWHCAGLAVLEDQMTTWIPGKGRSPDRVDAVVWLVGVLLGIHPVKGRRRLRA